MFTPYFTLMTTYNVGPYVSRSTSGYYSSGMCLVECFFTPNEDCHYAFVSSYSCNIGTFKLWPSTSYNTYPFLTAFINTGWFSCLL